MLEATRDLFDLNDLFLVGGQYTGRKKHEETTCKVITIQRDRHSEY